MNGKKIVLLLALVASLLALVGGAVSAAPPPVPQLLAGRLTGTLNIISGDHQDFSGAPLERITLVSADGQETPLILDRSLRNSLDVYRLTGQRVTVTAAPANNATSGLLPGHYEGALVVSAIEPATGTRTAQAAAVSGNTKWVNIGCKFNDIPDEPKPLSYLQNMFAATYPGLDAYWREASYDNINLVGSTAVGWFTLPKPMSAYQIDDDNIRWTNLLLDCAAQADAQIDFTQYKGINLMINGNPGCCAWGGNRTVTLDGIYRNWSVTWMPPWAYADLHYLQHEMTHGYGILWHSYANDNPYGDYWDVIGRSAGSGARDPVYGRLGAHTQVYHRAYLGWLPANRTVEVVEGPISLRLEQTTQPGPTGALMALIPINGSSSHYYAIEARSQVGFDTQLPGKSITIHEIGGPRHSVQLMDPGAIGEQFGYYVWKVGDTWAAPEGGIAVHVDAATATGFDITIQTGLEMRSLELPIAADTYIDAEAKDTNFGDDSNLRIRSGSIFDYPLAKAAFLRFDPAQLPTNILRARVRLTLAEGTITGHLPSVQHAGFQPDWQEAGMTWTSAKDAFVGWSFPYVYSPTAQGPDWLEWDVIGPLTRYGPQALSSLQVDNGAFTFSSREGANPPQLIVDYLVQPSVAETVTLTPTNDAYVQELRPANVFGTRTTLRVKNASKDFNSYVKFNINNPAGTVQSATLRLYVTDPGPDGGDVYAVSPYVTGTSTQWLETGLSWNTAPAISGVPLAAIGNAVKNRWVEVDVTQAVIDGLANDSGRVALGVRNNSTNQVAYSSKEGKHPPELVVVFGDGAPPPPPPPSTTFTPTNDAYVQQSLPTNVFGTKTTLRVRDAASDYNSYVKFNVQGLPGEVDQAILRLYVTDAGPDGGRVYGVSPTVPGTTTQWLETDLRWNNAPALSGSPIAALGAVSANAWVEVDVTAAVSAGVADDNGRVAFALSNDSSDLVVYSSKEGAHPPELVVVTR